jgi:hypothetical protein
MPEIQQVSHRHEAIMNYMLANPTAPMSSVAREFGVTQPWLSCIVHSHAFKTRLRAKQDELFGNIGATITEKLEAVAHIALDNLLDHVSASNAGPAMSLDVADKVLHRLGYAPSKVAQPTQSNTQINVVQISRDDLASARELLNSTKLPELPSDARSQGSNGGGLLEYAAPVSTQD